MCFSNNNNDNDEIYHLCNGVYPAERVLVFTAFLLQHDSSVSKGADIHKIMERHLSLWREKKFDLLIQEAQGCDRALCNSLQSFHSNDNVHMVRVFTKIMIQGNVRAAVCWITESSGGGLLHPTEAVVHARTP